MNDFVLVRRADLAAMESTIRKIADNNAISGFANMDMLVGLVLMLQKIAAQKPQEVKEAEKEEVKNPNEGE